MKKRNKKPDKRQTSLFIKIETPEYIILSKAKRRLIFMYKNLVKNGKFYEARKILLFLHQKRLVLEFNKQDLQVYQILMLNKFKAIYKANGILFDITTLLQKETSQKETNKPEKLTIKDLILIYVNKQTRVSKINTDIKNIRIELSKLKKLIINSLANKENKNIYIETINKTYSLIYSNSDFKIIEIQKIK